MDFFTHVVFGTLVYLLLVNEIPIDYLFLAIFFSILPDLDILLFPLKRIFKSKYLEHRGGSHSYIVGIIISFIVSVFNYFLFHQSFLIVWIIVITFYGLHVSMDLLTTTKIPYLYPLSKRENCFNIEKAGSFFTLLNSIVFLIFIIPLYFYSADISFLWFIINLFTYFFILYYAYRILSKIWLSKNLSDNQKFLPGILPFNFLIYTHEIKGNKISSSVEKKSHFSKKIETINSDIILKPEESVLFEYGLDLCLTNYYFTKWTIFPTIIRNGRIFSVKFFFLETMMRNKTMYVNFDFDIFSQQLIGYNQGSGLIQM
ncbi:MAG: metal-dependent hydrolase [Candidatus Hermodarchaeota archaeon]